MGAAAAAAVGAVIIMVSPASSSALPITAIRRWFMAEDTGAATVILAVTRVRSNPTYVEKDDADGRDPYRQSEPLARGAPSGLGERRCAVGT
jgi:hypothetical protein